MKEKERLQSWRQKMGKAKATKEEEEYNGWIIDNDADIDDKRDVIVLHDMVAYSLRFDIVAIWGQSKLYSNDRNIYFPRLLRGRWGWSAYSENIIIRGRKYNINININNINMNKTKIVAYCM
jgi:hypothetical protein